MSKVFIVDLKRCNGCRCCQVACKDEHCGQAWMPYAQEQPETGQFWMKVNYEERGQVPVVRLAYEPRLCNHCDDCRLVEAAPEAVYRREDGLVVIDPVKSEGMKSLVEACPHGAVYWNEALGIPQKCTGCAHLLDDGWSVPRCVDACATDALRFGDEEDFADEIAAADRSELELATGARVYYLGRHKRFVAGTVVDLQINEVLIGARATALGNGGDVVATATTDDFGDFMFEDIEAGPYEIRVEADGYASRAVPADASERDASLGVIEMEAL